MTVFPCRGTADARPQHRRRVRFCRPLLLGLGSWGRVGVAEGQELQGPCKAQMPGQEFGSCPGLGIP